jgi:hypothetical protein
MLRVSACVASVVPRRSSPEHSAHLQQARDLLLRGQGNDAYWHGVFGGPYAPHLRTELWRNLVRSETMVDQLNPGGQIPRVEFLDYDADGVSELLFTSPEYQALLKPSDGATLAMFDFRPCGATVINSMQRRPEPYHTRLRQASGGPSGGAISIHDQVRVKEPNLERFLRYDRYPRHSFRLLLFEAWPSFAQYEALQLAERAGPAAGVFEIRHSSANNANFVFEETLEPEFATDQTTPPRVTITKHFLFGPAPHGCEISCDVNLTFLTPLSRTLRVGLESILNFLAPSAPDRFFDSAAGQQHLRFSGTVPGPILRVADGWQGVRATLHAPGCEEFWIAPIETVSESEGGFERVYQGSQLLALWRPDFTAKPSFSARLLWRLEAF